MKDFTIGQGETIRDRITVEETGAVSATFIATDGVTNVIEVEALFDGMTAYMNTSDTIRPPATYEYYYKILWDDDSVDYVPDFRNCDGECSLPTLTICEVPGVS